jgi:hypothetical protein
MRLLCCAIALLLVSAGCRPAVPIPDTHPVRGKILLADGTPLVGASIRLKVPESRTSTAGVTESDGSFELQTFSGRETVPGAAIGEYEYEVIGPMDAQQQQMLVEPVRPAKISVKAGENDVLIEVRPFRPTSEV